MDFSCRETTKLSLSFGKTSIERTTTKDSTGIQTIQKSSEGPIAFKSVDQRGANLVIENTSSGAEAKSQSLKGWRLRKTVAGSGVSDIPLKDFELGPSAIYTIWAKGAKDTATADNEQVTDEVSLCDGSCTWRILDEAGNEQAKLFAEFSREVPE